VGGRGALDPPAAAAFDPNSVDGSRAAAPQHALAADGPLARAPLAPQEVDLAIAADLGTLQRLPKIVGHGGSCRLIAPPGWVWAANRACLHAEVEG
jgi:hypothetical protein